MARAYSAIDADVRDAVTEVVGLLVGEAISKGIADAGTSAAGVVANLFSSKR